ncbi:MAG: hypothetical protein NTV43_02065 [Methylococcales bacterium]|nr:hypothetical protein [Methylococcales bacterium]
MKRIITAHLKRCLHVIAEYLCSFPLAFKHRGDMFTKPKFIAVSLVFVASFLTTSVGYAITIYDLKNDFSIASNPNSQWSYVWNSTVITRSDSYQSLWREWGYTVPHDGSIMQWNWTTPGTPLSGWHDYQGGDIAIHTLSVPYGGGSTNVGFSWTSLNDGYISISGMAWDAAFSSGRNANWTLSVGGALVAQHTGVYGLYRNDLGAQFDNNLLSGASLTSLPILAGEKVTFLTQTTSSYGHFMGVDMSVTFSSSPLNGVPEPSSFTISSLGIMLLLKRKLHRFR